MNYGILQASLDQASVTQSPLSQVWESSNGLQLFNQLPPAGSLLSAVLKEVLDSKSTPLSTLGGLFPAGSLSTMLELQDQKESELRQQAFSQITELKLNGSDLTPIALSWLSEYALTEEPATPR